jgi:hypothetical protein
MSVGVSPVMIADCITKINKSYHAMLVKMRTQKPERQKWGTLISFIYYFTVLVFDQS